MIFGGRIHNLTFLKKSLNYFYMTYKREASHNVCDENSDLLYIRRKSMIDITRQSSSKGTVATGKQRNYNEIVEYLDKHWSVNQNSKTLDRMKKLDSAFGSPSQKINAILVAGTNGKSLTVHFTAKLLREEGLKVGAFYSPHILTYNERLTINHEIISNKLFTEIGNEVINMAEGMGIEAHSQEILTMMALLYFTNNNIDVALLEVSNGGQFNPVNICNAKIATITRVTANNVQATEAQLQDMAKEMLGIVKAGTIVISGDQNKANLQLMQDITKSHGGQWAMPIRKLATLPYPFGSIHGRPASLAERIGQKYIEKFVVKDATIVSDSILIKSKGKRGRPTLEDNRKKIEYPKKTVDQFWKEAFNELPGRFQLLDKEKPTILLDVAKNIDAFTNILLGIRLLHYQRPLKGLSIVVCAAQDALHNEEFVKLIRYFFKKTSGKIFICPLEDSLPGINEDKSWNVEQVTNDIKAMKINAKACKNFEEAFDLAKKSVDERHGLVVITGSLSIVNMYWRLKGIKKFN